MVCQAVHWHTDSNGVSTERRTFCLRPKSAGTTARTDCDPQELRHYGISVRPSCVCCTLGVLYNCVPSRVWCTFLPRKMNHISQLWSGSKLNTTETRSRPFVWVFSQVSYQARRFLSITKCSARAIRSKLIKTRQTGSIFVSRRTICFWPFRSLNESITRLFNYATLVISILDYAKDPFFFS